MWRLRYYAAVSGPALRFAFAGATPVAGVAAMLVVLDAAPAWLLLAAPAALAALAVGHLGGEHHELRRSCRHLRAAERRWEDRMREASRSRHLPQVSPRARSAGYELN